MSSKKRKLNVKELVIYCVCGAFVLWGLTYTILGLVAKFMPVTPSHNPIYVADLSIRKAFGLGFFGWGLILTGVFALVAVFTLVYFAKDVDKEYEKSARRAARLARNVVNEEAPKEANVVDAEVK